MVPDVKTLGQRSKETLARIRKDFQAKHLTLDEALSHAFLAGTEHMAELRRLEQSTQEKVPTKAP